MSPRFGRRSTNEQLWEHFRDRLIHLNLRACPSRHMSKQSAIYGYLVSKISENVIFDLKNSHFEATNNNFHQKILIQIRVPDHLKFVLSNMYFRHLLDRFLLHNESMQSLRYYLDSILQIQLLPERLELKIERNEVLNLYPNTH